MGGSKMHAKGRRDHYYQLAKEQGFRSRAAFKLVQLDRRFGFLAHARGILDLCAAPGGWMQVARKYAPRTAAVVGIDLDPIRPIRGCDSIVGDITSAKSAAALRRTFMAHGQPCDVVLHDGAPNVGAAWLSDAYGQNELVLYSLRIAVSQLARGGWFVTKVFRSKDYNALIWVFRQLFERVEATKPAASRDVSAEIFVACSGFVKPKSIDPRLLDPKHVFATAEGDEAGAAGAGAGAGGAGAGAGAGAESSSLAAARAAAIALGLPPPDEDGIGAGAAGDDDEDGGGRVDPAEVVRPETVATLQHAPQVLSEADAYKKLFARKLPRQKAEGYSDAATRSGGNLYERVSAARFVCGEDPLALLVGARCISLDPRDADGAPDSPDAKLVARIAADAKLTTGEIEDLCEDVRVLGKSDTKQLLKWRDALRKKLGIVSAAEAAAKAAEEAEALEAAEAEAAEAALTDDQKLTRDLEARVLELKRKRKRARRKLAVKRKARQYAIDIGMIHKGDTLDTSDIQGPDGLFRAQQAQAAVANAARKNTVDAAVATGGGSAADKRRARRAARAAAAAGVVSEDDATDVEEARAGRAAADRLASARVDDVDDVVGSSSSEEEGLALASADSDEDGLDSDASDSERYVARIERELATTHAMLEARRQGLVYDEQIAAMDDSRDRFISRASVRRMREDPTRHGIAPPDEEDDQSDWQHIQDLASRDSVARVSDRAAAAAAAHASAVQTASGRGSGGITVDTSAADAATAAATAEAAVPQTAAAAAAAAAAASGSGDAGMTGAAAQWFGQDAFRAAPSLAPAAAAAVQAEKKRMQRLIEQRESEMARMAAARVESESDDDDGDALHRRRGAAVSSSSSSAAAAAAAAAAGAAAAASSGSDGEEAYASSDADALSHSSGEEDAADQDMYRGDNKRRRTGEKALSGVERARGMAAANAGEKDAGDFEVVPREDHEHLHDDMDDDGKAQALAIGSLLVNGQLKKEHLEDNIYNRYMFADTDADSTPAWFRDDEYQHNKPTAPVTKEQVDEHRRLMREIDARPMKKVAEARARKKLRAARKLQQIRARAEAIADMDDLTPGERMRQIETLYRQKKSAIEGPKTDRKYVVARAFSTKSGGREGGRRTSTRKTKYVDTRMRADARGKKTAERKAKARGKKRRAGQ